MSNCLMQVPWATCDNAWNTPNCRLTFAKYPHTDNTSYNLTLDSSYANSSGPSVIYHAANASLNAVTDVIATDAPPARTYSPAHEYF